MEIKDSGSRTEFESGAVRDIQVGKGRCDLVPFGCFGGTIADDDILFRLSSFLETRDKLDLLKAIDTYIKFEMPYKSVYEMMLELSKHFENGAKKYGEYNWQKGIPVERYIDSAMRHYLKAKNGEIDEKHFDAFIWNVVCCIWTCENKPELNNYVKGEE